MPSVLAHYIFLKEAEKNLNPISLIGAQGPDPFFFNVIALKNDEKNKKITDIGHFLHNIDPLITFRYCIEYIKKSNAKDRPILLDYFKGMLAHYSLDSVAHPYIFYLSGFVTNDPENAGKFFLSHASIETMIDAKCRDHYHYKITSPGALKFNKNDLKVVSKMMQSYLNNVWKYDFVEDDSFYKAVKRMRLAYKVIYSHTGFKKFIYHNFMRESLPNVLSVPKLKNVPNLDFMNEKHSLFTDCCTNLNPRTCTFYDLMDEGIDKFHKLEKLTDDILEDKATFEDMAEITKNIDHDGKIVGTKMKHFQLIWNLLDEDKK